MDRVSVLEWRAGPEKGPSVYRKTDLLVNAPKIGKENRFMPRRRQNTIKYAKVNQNTISYTKKPSSHPLHGVQSHRNICNWSGLAGKSILQKPNRAGEPTVTLRFLLWLLGEGFTKYMSIQCRAWSIFHFIVFWLYLSSLPLFYSVLLRLLWASTAWTQMVE